MLQSKEQIGKLDRKITFQEKVKSTNVSNEVLTTTWADIANSPEVWANVEDKFGAEEIQADQVIPVKTTHFTIRFRSDVTTDNRIVFDDEVFNILYPIKIGRKAYLKLVAESGGHYQE